MEEGNEENAADTANDAEEDFKSKAKSTIAVVEDDEASHRLRRSVQPAGCKTCQRM